MSPMFPCVTALYRGLCCHLRWRIPPSNENIATNFTGRNLLTFCTFVLVAGGSLSISFFSFPINIYIFPNLKLIIIVMDNFQTEFCTLEYDCDGDIKQIESEMIQNPRENHERGKRHPHDFLTPNAFTTVWRVPVSCYFSGVTRALFFFLYESTRNIPLFPLDHHRLLFFSISYFVSYLSLQVFRIINF